MEERNQTEKRRRRAKVGSKNVLGLFMVWTAYVRIVVRKALPGREGKVVLMRR